MMTVTQAKRFTREEYHQLIELGFFQADDRVELIRGEIVLMAAKGTPHSTLGTRLQRELWKLIDERATMRTQEPIVLLEDGEPEPDVAIVQNRADDYLLEHPRSADILLLIEIADSSLEYDQKVKLSLYAEAGISDYWIFNLIDNWLEVYSEPYEISQNKFGYLNKRLVLPNQVIVLPCLPDLFLDLAKVFPKLQNLDS